jgi:hypothetical protein
MPSYDIIYSNLDGTAARKIEAECADDREARILAHAMKDTGPKRILVWSGDTLVYHRPLTSAGV